MGKIVQNGVKIDLHIHSQASSNKDGGKVKNNTIENIPILIEKLNQNEVNICAITDHDIFCYSTYKKLKEAEIQDNSISKVLPGVEFSVFFEAPENSGVIHIVTLFSDKDDNQVQKIEEILNNAKYDKHEAFSENEFLNILRLINIDTILIAHQKNSLLSSTVKKNDANSLGNDRFLEFVYSDYFEALEFKNRRNEILNKSYLISNKSFDDRIHFVTGTDCHDWNVYPAQDSTDCFTDEFPYTYAKCLPTFKGLVMAMTDRTRLKMVDSFFNVQRHFIDSIELTAQDSSVSIPLSKGINAIIGDNSIGKSMLLHAMTKFTKPGISQIKSGYKKYLKENKIKVNTHIKDDSVFCFDMQEK